MKKLKKAAILIGGAILVSQSAFATNTVLPNYLYMGFQNSAGGGSADYIINLGASSGIIGQSSQVDLSSAFQTALFNNSALQGTSFNIYMGVVGGDNNISDVFGTTLRTSNIGNPTVAGSSAPAGLTKQSADNTTYSTLAQIAAPSVAGQGVLDSTKSWEAYIEPTLTASTYSGSAFNPDSPLPVTGTIYEDLYETIDTGDARGSSGQPWNYLGYFALNTSSGSLTFTSVNAVPEPSTCALIGSGSLLLLVLRRRSFRKVA